MSSDAFRLHRLSGASGQLPHSGSLRVSVRPLRSSSFTIAELDTRGYEFCPLPARIEPGTRIDEFSILEAIGAGGTSTVFRALQTTRDRDVALKVLSPHLIGVPEAVSRFELEAELAARLAHPGVVPTYCRGIDGGYHYYAMKLMTTPTLAEFISGCLGARDEGFFREAALLFAYLSRTVADLHANGVVHGDIKPANLFLASNERVVLGDFGVAVDLNAPTDALRDDEGAEPRVLGTPAYMSPERFVRVDASRDPRGDIYAIGLGLYELLTGLQPFAGDDQEEIARAKLTRKPPSPRSVVPTIPLGLEAIVRQAIETRLELRYRSAEELARNLERFANTRRTGTRTHPSQGPIPGDGLDGKDDDADDRPQPALVG